jgi:hypothetical protein
MQTTWRELVTAIHGMMFGGLFLMTAFAFVMMLYRSLAAEGPEESGEAGRHWDRIYLIVMVLLGWGAVLSGTYVVYPWYRATAPAGVVNLASWPQRLLLSDPHTAGWHELGMEWKEHVAWMAPILMTMAAWVLMRYKEAVEQQRRLRVTVAMFALTGLLATGVAAGFGAWINKKAPVAGGSTIALAQDRK